MKRSLSAVALAVLLGACAVSDPVAPDTQLAPVGEASLNRQFFNRKVDVCLTLLHNNDGESQLINAGDGLEDFGGIARFATVVRKLRRQSERGLGATRRAKRCGVSVLRSATLLVSSGDNYLAGPEFNASVANGVFYDAIALDRIRYDAIVLGNHEFDFGPQNLADFISAFNRRDEQFVSANLDFSGEPALQSLVNRRRIAKSTIVVDGGERFGIVGATTPALPTVSSPGNVIVSAMVAQEVQAEIDRLMRRGIDKIIFISHLQSIEEDRLLIPQLRGVDIAVAGGGDDLLANDGDLLVPGDVIDPSKPYPLIVQDADGRDVPLVTTSGSYRYVGRLVVGFDRRGEILMVEDGSGPVRVAGGSQPDAVQPNARIQAEVVEPVQAFVADLAATTVATTAVDLDGRRSQVRSVETNQGNLIADGLFFTAQQRAAQFGAPQPDVALANGGGIRNDAIIAAGSTITALTTFDISPFGNFVTIVPNIPRAQFLAILENAVSRVEFGDGRFAQVSGFSFSWNPTAPAGSRVVDVVLDGGAPIVLGGVVQAGSALNIATLDFLARGGDSYPYAGAPFTALGVTDQQALQNYLTAGLGGTVSAADYPAGGEGRIVRLP